MALFGFRSALSRISGFVRIQDDRNSSSIRHRRSVTSIKSGKKRAHKLTKSPCPTDGQRDKQGCTGRCPRDLLFLTIEKLPEKGIFCRDTAWCPRDTRPSPGGSRKICAIFSLCVLFLPKKQIALLRPPWATATEMRTYESHCIATSPSSDQQFRCRHH